MIRCLFNDCFDITYEISKGNNKKSGTFLIKPKKKFESAFYAEYGGFFANKRDKGLDKYDG